LDLSRDAVFTVQNNYNLWHTLASIHFELKDYEKAKKVVMIAIVTGRRVNGTIPRECLQLLKKCKEALGETEDGGGAGAAEDNSNR
jgi:hypothetical protein